MTSPDSKPTKPTKTNDDDGKSATRTVRLATPAFVDKFTADGITITRHGVELSTADAEKVRAAAKRSRIRLRELS